MLVIRDLGMRFEGYSLFENLNRSFSPGCYALTEEESTGKSILLQLVAGVLAPTEGDILLNGHSMVSAPQLARAQLAYIPANSLEHPQLTGYELLARVASQKKTPITEETLDLAHRLDLAGHLEKRFEQMSTGMRRKVYLAAAELGDPAVIVADGPSDGLDARACAVVAEQFASWGRDRVVLFASHDAALVDACEARRLAVQQLV